MRKLFTALFITLIASQVAQGCTTFFIKKNGQLAFGRNYDWVTDVGLVCTNLRGLQKTSLKTFEGETISWVSKYGSITFNQYGKEFPMGGMNEKGLVVELMWLDGSQYPKPDNRAAMGVLQWVQYQLDNCSTIEEVIATDKNIRISPIGSPPLHYLVADLNGQAATIEFLNGKMVVHKGNDLPLPVLTNTDYATSARLVKEAGEIANKGNSTAFNDNSVQRFASACSMVKQYQQSDMTRPIIDFSFEILNKVSVEGFTKWSIVYDLNNKKVYFKTTNFPQVKSIAFRDVDFTCKSTPMVYDMNQAMEGNVTKHFKPFTNEANASLLDRAALESKSAVHISESDRKRDVAYAAKIECMTNSNQ